MKIAIRLSYIFMFAMVTLELVGASSSEETFDCPKKYHDCTRCTKYHGKIFAVGSAFCGKYSQKLLPHYSTRCRMVDSESEWYLQECEAMYGENRFTCPDLCNSCSCDSMGVSTTLMGCPNYSKKQCEKKHGKKTWSCGTATCACTDAGFGIHLKE